MQNHALSILFIGHAYLVTASQKKLLELQKRGCRVGVLVPSNWRDQGALFAGKWLMPQKTAGLFMYSAPVIRNGHVASHLYLPGAISRFVHSFQPDIVQVEQEVYSFVAAQAALELKASDRKLIVFGWENLDRGLHIAQRLCRKITLRAADAIICGNQDGASLVRQWGYKGIIEVMPQLGIDPLEFSPALPKQIRRQAPNFTIGFVGRFVPEKGGDTLLQAFSMLIKKGLNVQLMMLGSGPEMENWRKLARELGIAKQVNWLDAVPHNEVPNIMAHMDALVLPSKSTPYWKEQFGLVLAQAMSMGLPVIGSNCGAIPEVIGRQDVIFPEGDAQSLSLILERIILDETWRQELSQHSRERALRWYTHEALAERLIGLYNKLGFSHSAMRK